MGQKIYAAIEGKLTGIATKNGTDPGPEDGRVANRLPHRTKKSYLLIGTSATNMFCIYHRGWILKRICGFDLKWVPNAPLRTFGQGYIALRFPPTFQGSEIHYL